MAVWREKAQAARNTPSRLRQLLEAGFLDDLRSYDAAQLADLGLRDALADQKRRLESEEPLEAILPAVYALVNEAIQRRLGAWRLFDPSFEAQGLEKYREMARQLLESVECRSVMNVFAGEAPSPFEEFVLVLAPLLADMNLTMDEETIVSAIAYVVGAGGGRSWAHVSLSAEFYQALSAEDQQQVLRFQPTDEQLLAGALLYQGLVVEMNAGEGKTIAAAFPAVLHALKRQAVHIITANDYLASRDADLLGPVYESLGISVGAVLGYMSDAEKRHQYQQDIVYGTLREFGFDFLRDNLRPSSDERLQRVLGAAIVDEADHALIDEAGVPLIISGSPTAMTRGIAKIKRGVEEMIVLQREAVRDLEEWISRVDRPMKELYRPLAKLLLADPESELTRKMLKEKSVSYKRVQALLDEEPYPSDEGLAQGLWYTVDARLHAVSLTPKGQDFLESRLGPLFDTGDLEDRLDRMLINREAPLEARRTASVRLDRELARKYSRATQVHQMLRASLVFKKNVDYVVTEGEVVLVDPLTGRKRPDSRYQRGLQSALEAKEGVIAHPEHEAVAQISVQGFVKQYQQVAGITGTAVSAQEEFRRGYGLDVVAVPPSRLARRVDLAPRLYTSRREKLAALVDEAKLCQQVGRPVLIGTLTIGQSEEISQLLTQQSVSHNLLNAVNDDYEAQIIRDAGAFGAVTVATNMAGRGTDIVLQPGLNERVSRGYCELVRRLIEQGVGEVVLRAYSQEEAAILWSDLLRLDSFVLQREPRPGRTDIVVSWSGGGTKCGGVTLDFGLGLYVIGTEMNDSRRVDLQLKGRGGRQGEFGASRFFLSLEDEFYLFRLDNNARLARETTVDASPHSYIEGKELNRQLGKIQTIVEQDQEAQRDALQQPAHCTDAQTLFYYQVRRDVMQVEGFHQSCQEFLREQARTLVRDHLANTDDAWRDGLAEQVWIDYQVDCASLWGFELNDLAEELGELLVAGLEERRSLFGDRAFRELERLLFLQTGDELWREQMADLQDAMLSAQLSSYGHPAAVAEYAKRTSEAYGHFREQVVDTFLPRLMTFPVETDTTGPQVDRELPEEIAKILV
jgi:preprotein translocase subunit SecA